MPRWLRATGLHSINLGDIIDNARAIDDVIGSQKTHHESHRMMIFARDRREINTARVTGVPTSRREMQRSILNDVVGKSSAQPPQKITPWRVVCAGLSARVH